ncbi:3-isopropylmalate dehydrogenase [Clostridium gasigenes]|uniref:3-isopropylmalate dehydrogenase n=1 Tax=Clostridium gasigenes TaxID=94869 RepID=UPI0016252924|nr:3-isopropylmalate dehydrogenase [Clostridium gasigenes]MBB6625631.1 3-isopropylmalate dehydrogenase [Clostridium gasigenes]
MKIAVIGGDGIGPEVVRESIKVLQAIGEKYKIYYELKEYPYSADYYLSTGITIDKEVFTEWPNKYTAILFGAIGDKRVKSNKHAKEILLGIRFNMDLYVNYRPIKLLNKKYCPLKQKNEEDIDFVIFRENTEDLYSGSGGTLKKGTDDEVAIENSIHTRKGVERIIRYAFEYAKNNNRTSVVMSDKSNVMKYSGDLWQRVFEEVGREYPQIEKRSILIDALHMEIIRNPSQFEVIVTSNMFGDIVTDMCAQIQGGMGLAASANINPDNGLLKGLYEPIHGSAPDIAGKGIANPIASILSLALLLEDHNYFNEANTIYEGIKYLLKNGIVTKDLGGDYRTEEVGNHLVTYIKNI